MDDEVGGEDRGVDSDDVWGGRPNEGDGDGDGGDDDWGGRGV